MLSLKALYWLKSIGYGKYGHEERMILIKAAKILYPSADDEQDEQE